MATCQALIKRALRMLGQLNSGREPPANEAADCLEALKGLYKHLVATGTFGRLHDVLASASLTAGENQRIVNTSGGAITITLPTQVYDCDTFDARGGCGPWDYGFINQVVTGMRPPRDHSVVVEAGTVPITNIYDADLAAWVVIDNLALTDEAPFTQKLETGMAALLAVHIAPEYGDAAPSPIVLTGAGACMSALSNRADSPADVSASEYF